LLLGSVYMVWEYAQQSSNVICSIASHFQTFARQNADYSSAAAITDLAPAAVPPTNTCAGWDSLAVRDLTFTHAAHRGDQPALEKVALSLQRGKRYALIGGSGSGKSTLLRVLAGLYSAERVSLAVDGGAICVAPTTAAAFLRANATLIPQDAELYEGTLAENLSLCESVNGPPGPAEFGPALEAACVTDFLEPSSLQAPLAERAANWSGGQRARVALARGMLAAAGSGLVLLDEPTASLDPAATKAFEDVIRAIVARGIKVVMSTHDLGEARRLAGEIVLLHRGRVVESAASADFFAAPQSPEARKFVAGDLLV
jgi:ATP-binding cassette, subfamily B, bacterial